MHKNSRQQETLHWLLIMGLPYSVILVLKPSMVVFLFLSAVFGVFTVLFAPTAWFSIQFKLSVFTVAGIAVLLAVIGWRSRQKIWGKILFSFAVLLWSFIGLLGLGSP